MVLHERTQSTPTFGRATRIRGASLHQSSALLPHDLPCLPPTLRELAATTADAAAAAGQEKFLPRRDGGDLQGAGDGLLKESMVCPVFAALPQEQQLEAFEPAPKGTRKFVLVSIYPRGARVTSKDNTATVVHFLGVLAQQPGAVEPAPRGAARSSAGGTCLLSSASTIGGTRDIFVSG